MPSFPSNGRLGDGGRRERGCPHFDESCFARCTVDYLGKAELLNGTRGGKEIGLGVPIRSANRNQAQKPHPRRMTPEIPPTEAPDGT